MLAFDPPITGFTTWSAEGHGFSFKNASINERVRGHVSRQVILAVLPRETARALLDAIERSAAFPQLTYWIEPVESFGRMQRATPGSIQDNANP